MKTFYFYTICIAALTLVSSCAKEKKSQDPQTNLEKEVSVSWSETQVDEFMNNCMVVLEKEGVNAPKSYCDCLLESSMASYPDPKVAMELEQHHIVGLFEESNCLDDILLIKLEDPWTEEVEQLFTEHCKKAQADQGASEADAEAYCDCALQEIKTIVPNPHHVMALTEVELEHILEKCKP